MIAKDRESLNRTGLKMKSDMWNIRIQPRPKSLPIIGNHHLWKIQTSSRKSKEVLQRNRLTHRLVHQNNQEIHWIDLRPHQMFLPCNQTISQRLCTNLKSRLFLHQTHFPNMKALLILKSILDYPFHSFLSTSHIRNMPHFPHQDTIFKQSHQ